MPMHHGGHEQDGHKEHSETTKKEVKLYDAALLNRDEIFTNAASYNFTSFFAYCKISGFNKDPEYITRSAFSNSFFALIVINSGSPGPDPTK